MQESKTDSNVTSTAYISINNGSIQMKIENYTTYNQNNISKYRDIENIDEAVDFLKNPDSFRSFDKGMAELIKRTDYSGDYNDIGSMTDYLILHLRKIGSAIEKETVFSWFSGKHCPKIESGSRQKMYEICFSLNLTLEDTIWFFQHVYYDRAFNCHTIREAVYYYSFMHNISYHTALDIIKAINEAPEPPADNIYQSNYTRFVQNRIKELSSTDELIKFLSDNKGNFNVWNQTALNTLNKLITKIIGPSESKTDIDTLKRNAARRLTSNSHSSKKDTIDITKYKHCGFIIREIISDANKTSLYDSPEEYIFDTLHNKNVMKNTFILEHLLSSHTGMKKSLDIPYIVRNNFPSKKTMSDVLSDEKISVSKSYDSIRKMIILLDFYCFWVEIKLNPDEYSELSPKERQKIYVEEINNCLYECGYEELYAGNPYDWIFLCSAISEKPLEFFRSYMSELIPDIS